MINHSRASRWRRRLHRLSHLYRELYYAPHRRMLARRNRQQADLFRLLISMESLGLPNPAAFYTLELTPFLLEDFHDWHRRMGMEKSPLEGYRCC